MWLGESESAEVHSVSVNILGTSAAATAVAAASGGLHQSEHCRLHLLLIVSNRIVSNICTNMVMKASINIINCTHPVSKGLIDNSQSIAIELLVCEKKKKKRGKTVEKMCMVSLAFMKRLSQCVYSTRYMP